MRLDENIVHATCSILVVLGKFIQIENQLSLIILVSRGKIRNEVTDDLDVVQDRHVLQITGRNDPSGTPRVAKLENGLSHAKTSGHSHSELAKDLLNLAVSQDLWSTLQTKIATCKSHATIWKRLSMRVSQPFSAAQHPVWLASYA